MTKAGVYISVYFVFKILLSYHAILLSLFFCFDMLFLKVISAYHWINV